MLDDHLRTFVPVHYPTFVLPSGFRAEGWQVGTWNGFPVVALREPQYRALVDHLDTVGVETREPLYEGTPNRAIDGVWNCDGLQWELVA